MSKVHSIILSLLIILSHAFSLYANPFIDLSIAEPIAIAHADYNNDSIHYGILATAGFPTDLPYAHIIAGAGILGGSGMTRVSNTTVVNNHTTTTYRRIGAYRRSLPLSVGIAFHRDIDSRLRLSLATSGGWVIEEAVRGTIKHTSAHPLWSATISSAFSSEKQQISILIQLTTMMYLRTIEAGNRRDFKNVTMIIPNIGIRYRL